MLIQVATALAIALHGGEASERKGAPALQRFHDSTLAVAESLLAAGRLADARRVAEHLEDRNPNDPRVLTLLGRIHLEWPVIGRFAAESLFARAGRIEPANPEPFYWLGQAGLKLGGDDGESIARRGLVRVLALDPDYRDAWRLWNRLYAGPREKREAVQALARHAGTDPADGYRARLLVDLGRYDEALIVLGELARRQPEDVATRVLMARAYYEQGHDVAGWAAYEQALAVAHNDTAQILWRQVRSIATPTERALWQRTTPAQRASFFRVFWTRREPNMFADGNERLGEHFRRMVEAQRDFRLLHPNSRYHRSSVYRSLMGAGRTGEEQAALMRRAQDMQCTAGFIDSLVRERYAQGMGPRMDPDSTGASPNIEDGLDDRGRIWVRHGPPTARFIYGTDGETWCYERPEGTFRVTFIRRTGVFGHGGDVVITPSQPGEAQSASLLLRSDRPATEYSLDFRFWHAAFRSDDERYTDLLIFPDSVSVIAALMGGDGLVAVRDSGTGRHLKLRSEPGHWLLMLDARQDERLGSYRGPMPVPDFDGSSLAISSLLIASGDVDPERDSMAAHAPAGLRLPANAPMRLYAELYGLGRMDGVSRYEARYRFVRLDGERNARGRETVVGFQREARFAPRVIETLIIDPGRLEPGRYRLRLEIVDQIRATTLVGTAMELQLQDVSGR